MKNDLEQLERLDTDSATITSLWFGVGGFFVGVIGIGLTIYTLYAKEPSIFWLTLSGWIAAVLTAFSLGYIGNKLVKLAGNQSRRLQTFTGKLEQLQVENTRLIEINAFIVTKGLRSTTPRAKAQGKNSPSTENHGTVKTGDSIEGENVEN